VSCLIYCCAECRYAECHYAVCRYAECHYAVCRYAECRGTLFPTIGCLLACARTNEHMDGVVNFDESHFGGATTFSITTLSITTLSLVVNKM
jgi:hypothetical protein